MVIVTGINAGFVPQLDANEAQRRSLWQSAAAYQPPLTQMMPESLRVQPTKTNFRTGAEIKDLNGARGLGIFENFGAAAWAWEHRKGLLIGGGILALLGAASILRSL